MNPVGEALESFLSQIDDLAQRFGEEQVLLALETHLPGFDKNVSTPRETVEPLMEQSKTPEGKAVRTVRDYFAKKGVSGATGDVAKVGVGGAGVAATGAPVWGQLVGKEWDQDVNIDDITTDKPLNVKSDSLEQALIDTNDAIKKMTQTLLQTQQQLSGKLDSIDTSVDDSIAAETGETASQVQVRQRVGLKEPLKRRDKEEQGKEKRSSEKTIKEPA